MKLVFTHPDPIIVAQMRTAIEREGIDCTLRNEYASGAIGELAPIDTWAEVWVLRTRDAERAQRVLANLALAEDSVDWQCGACGRSSPETFELCWHCGEERDAVTGPG